MDLSDDMMDQYAVCRFDRTIIQGRKNDLGECSIDIITRIEAQMQGNYRLEIRLTLSDILTLFWIAFKDKALQAIFQNKLAPEKSEARESIPIDDDLGLSGAPCANRADHPA